MKKLVKNSLPSILTPDDKKYLRMICRYLNSLGMNYGSIDIEINDDNINPDNIDWKYTTEFSNNYRAEIPEGLIDILKKILQYVDDNKLYTSPDVDNLNYERIDFSIDTKSEVIGLSHLWSYTDVSADGSSKYWEDEDGDELFKKWNDDGSLNLLTIPDNGILILRYNGSGDSGYIENTFEETGDSVPAAIEDWCYRQLENNFGGWEINEGSQGYFDFNFHKAEIQLHHSYNIDEQGEDTLFEENFSK